MDYKKMNHADFNFLKSLLGLEQVTTLGHIEKDYSHDELGTVFGHPEAHVIVKNKAQIQSIMK